jgi:membrane-bound lytic murein transglycosylase D
VARGASEVGSLDIGEIVGGYHGKAFGFASRNFYAEFVAALEVVARANELYGGLHLAAPLRERELEIKSPMTLHQAARLVGLPRDDLLEANPALLAPVASGRKSLPRGYVLRIPVHGQVDEARVQVASVEPSEGDSAADEPSAATSVDSHDSGKTARASHTTASKRRSTVASAASRVRRAVATLVHQVRPGQTLVDIARRYGTTVAMIRGANNLRDPKSLQVGQRLKIPQRT